MIVDIDKNEVITFEEENTPIEDNFAPIQPTKTQLSDDKKKRKKENIKKKEQQDIPIELIQYSLRLLSANDMRKAFGRKFIEFTAVVLLSRKLINCEGVQISCEGFNDPRLGYEGEIYAEKVFVNDEDNSIQGINFVDEKGQFCCSYIGENYDDIREKNISDCEKKIIREAENDKQFLEFDEYGVPKNYPKNEISVRYSGGIKR